MADRNPYSNGAEGHQARAEAKEYEPDSYWNARLERDFSLSGVGHSGVGLRFNAWAYRVRRRVLLRVLREHGVELRDATVLELGFGTGYYLDLWRRAGVARVLGFDIAGVAVSEARKRFADTGWRFEQADIGRPLPPAEPAANCTLATAFDVLFHLVDDAAWSGALDNLSRSLAPGGHLVIFDKFQRRESARSHVKRRALAAYREALAARGLEVLAVRPIFFLMNSPTDLEGVAKPFVRLLWSLVRLPYKAGRVVGAGEALGGAMGALCYWPEVALGRCCAGGPSTKVLLARKR